MTLLVGIVFWYSGGRFEPKEGSGGKYEIPPVKENSEAVRNRGFLRSPAESDDVRLLLPPHLVFLSK